MRQTQTFLEVQEHAQGPLSPCQVCLISDITCCWGNQKCWVFVWLSVHPHYTVHGTEICSWLPPFCKQNLLFIQPRWQLRRTYFFNLYNVSITLWNGKVCENDFAQKASELRSGFDVVGWGKVCSCVPTFNFVSMPLGGTTAECWSWKCGKFWQFFRLSRTIE